MKVLFLPAGGLDLASSRFRVYRYLPALEEAGWRVTAIPGPGLTGRIRPAYLAKVLLAAARADVVVLQKRPLGRAFHLLRRANTRLVYDLDDALWAPPPTPIPQSLLQQARKGVTRAMRMSRVVVVGNRFLEEYARRYSQHPVVIPTPIDTRQYFPLARPANPSVSLGWIGNPENLRYIEIVGRALAEVGRRYGARVRLVIVSSQPPPDLPGIAVSYRPWALEREVAAIQEFDIGLMPLEDTDWCRGKCAFKALQYMALAIPAVCSPVGMASEVVTDGENGMLASTHEEWVEKLSVLIEDVERRRALGERGRQTVLAHFSLERTLPKLMGAIELAAHG